MGPESHIDNRVQGAMGSFEPPPPPGGWDRLEVSLNRSSKGAVVPFRRRLLSLAAVILAFVGGYFLAMMSASDQPLGHEQTIAQASVSDTATHNGTTGSERLDELTKRTDATAVASTSEDSDASDMRHGVPQQSFATSVVTPQPAQRQHLPTGKPVLPEELFSLIPMIALTEHLPELAIEIPYRIVRLSPIRATYDPALPMIPHALTKPHSRWSFAGIAGQTISNYYHGRAMPMEAGSYRNDLATTTPDQLFNPLISYGVGVGYNLTSNFGISTGLSMHQFSTPLINPTQAEYMVMSAERPVGNPLGEVQFNQQIKSSLAKTPQKEVFQGHYAQHLSYMEIPLTATWRMVDRRMGLGLRGGFGGNILQQNQVLYTEENSTETVGTTNGVKSMYISGIIGADLSIRFDERWRWSFVPVYRHALQSVSHTEYSPRIISFGLYTGLHFSF